MVETLKLRAVTQADKNYSLLISVPAPLNFFLFFAAPILLTNNVNPQKTNERLLFLFYIPILLVMTILFFIGEIIMWPLVYVKMIFHKLTMTWVYSKSFRVSRADKFMNFIVYVFIGPFVTIGNSFVDTYYFVRHMIQFDLQKIKHKTSK